MSSRYGVGSLIRFPASEGLNSGKWRPAPFSVFLILYLANLRDSMKKSTLIIHSVHGSKAGVRT